MLGKESTLQMFTSFTVQLSSVQVWYLLWKDNNLYERYEAEYEEGTCNVAPKTVIHLFGILQGDDETKASVVIISL